MSSSTAQSGGSTTHRGTRGRRRNLRVGSHAKSTAVVLGGITSVAALLALLIPEIAGDLSLTPWGKIVVAVGAGVFVTTTQRLLVLLTARRDVAAAVRTWPPECADGARLSTLGVYPARTAEPYVLRPAGEDSNVESALGNDTPQNVVIVGPPRCGKSRAASHAAAQKLKGLPVLAPLGADGLRTLLDRGADVKLRRNPKRTRCLWLDPLDEFAGTLDPSSIDALGASSQPIVRIIASVEREAWTKLLKDPGAQGQSARALADSATIVALKRPAGAAWNARLDLPLPGSAAALGPDDGAREHGTHPRPVKPRRLVRDAVLGSLVGGLLLVVAAGFYVGPGFGIDDIGRHDFIQPPSIEDQINTTIDNLEQNLGGHVVLSERVQLHRTDQPSWLVVLRGRDHSDQLRIYDVEGAHLTKELDYVPADGTRDGGSDTHVLQFVRLKAGARPYDDYADNGQDELIAAFTQPSLLSATTQRTRLAARRLLPFAVQWRRNRYTLMPLTPARPAWLAPGFEALNYGRPQTITNASKTADTTQVGSAITGYPIQAFALTRTPGLRLLTGYLARYATVGEARVLAIHANRIYWGDGINLRPCRYHDPRCNGPATPQYISVPADTDLSVGLLQGWGLDYHEWTDPVALCKPSHTEPCPSHKKHQSVTAVVVVRPNGSPSHASHT
jgi:hypothetical protein